VGNFGWKWRAIRLWSRCVTALPASVGQEAPSGFCPDCGSQVFYTEPTEPDLIVVSVGSFADPSFPPPTESGYDSRRHPWLAVPATIERHDGN
jgi:hypothetical protein